MYMNHVEIVAELNHSRDVSCFPTMTLLQCNHKYREQTLDIDTTVCNHISELHCVSH